MINDKKMEEQKIKVAIIEDEEVLLNVLENKLKKEGFDVVTALDGEIGVKVIRESLPDIILLDIIMPKVNGFEVLAQLNQDPVLAKIPVIIISNSGQPVEIDKALSLGAKDYLVKAEFDPQEVIEKIKKQLSSPASPQSVVQSANSDGTSPKINADINPSLFTILLVEDDNFLRDLISQKIKKEGFNVIEAIDGEDGVKKTSEHKPHLILLDLILPGMDGFEVLRDIHSNENSKKIPVIILSNLGQKDDIEKGMRFGAVDYLVKAHNTPGEIVDKVKEVLAKTYS